MCGSIPSHGKSRLLRAALFLIQKGECLICGGKMNLFQGVWPTKTAG